MPYFVNYISEGWELLQYSWPKKKKQKKQWQFHDSTYTRNSLSNFFQTFNCQEATVSKRFSGLLFYFVTGFAPIGNKKNYYIKIQRGIRTLYLKGAFSSDN